MVKDPLPSSQGGWQRAPSCWLLAGGCPTGSCSVDFSNMATWLFKTRKGETVFHQERHYNFMWHNYMHVVYIHPVICAVLNLLERNHRSHASSSWGNYTRIRLSGGVGDGGLIAVCLPQHDKQWENQISVCVRECCYTSVQNSMTMEVGNMGKDTSFWYGSFCRGE